MPDVPDTVVEHCTAGIRAEFLVGTPVNDTVAVKTTSFLLFHTLLILMYADTKLYHPDYTLMLRT